MGCALLKVLLREPLTCLEPETTWALAKQRPEVSGPRLSLRGGLREAGREGHTWVAAGRNPFLRRKAAPARPCRCSGPFLSLLLWLHWSVRLGPRKVTPAWSGVFFTLLSSL